MPEMEQSHRRASIQQIMRDSGLSQIEKQRSIQFLMDGRKLLQRRVTVECGSSSFGGGRGGSLVESMIGSNINSHDFAASATSAAATTAGGQHQHQHHHHRVSGHQRIGYSNLPPVLIL